MGFVRGLGFRVGSSCLLGHVAGDGSRIVTTG